MRVSLFVLFRLQPWAHFIHLLPGADPFLPNKENLTPLHLAECRGGAIYQALSDALGLPPPNNPPQQHSGGPSGPGSRRLTGGGSLPRRSVQGVGGGGGGGGGGGTRQVNHSRRLSTGTSPTTRLPEDFFNPNPQNPRRLTQVSPHFIIHFSFFSSPNICLLLAKIPSTIM